MDMVGHQRIGVDIAAAIFGIFAQPIEIVAVVRSGKKAVLPIIPSLDNMYWDTRQGDAWPSWHGCFLREITWPTLLRIGSYVAGQGTVVCPRFSQV
jgi:hypothetical protein